MTIYILVVTIKEVIFEVILMDAEKRYYLLFNRITDAIAELEELNIGKAKKILIEAQQNAEEAYLKEGETPEKKEEE